MKEPKHKRYKADEPLTEPGRILILDGGGTKGLAIIRQLKKLEALYSSLQKDGKNFLQQFDLIGGTSTGGIIAMGLAKGISLDKLEKLYSDEDVVKSIFPPSSGFFGDFLALGANLFGARANEKSLRTHLERVFNGKKLEKSGKGEFWSLHEFTITDSSYFIETNCFIAASKLLQIEGGINGVEAATTILSNYEAKEVEKGDESSHPVHWTAEDPSKIDLIDALMATSAVPGFFPPVKVGKNYLYDGALEHSNPIFPAITEFHKLYKGQSIFFDFSKIVFL